MADVYEQFFFLKYHGSWSFSEAYNLPIKLRHWFVHRLVKQLEQEKEEKRRERIRRRLEQMNKAKEQNV